MILKIVNDSDNTAFVVRMYSVFYFEKRFVVEVK